MLLAMIMAIRTIRLGHKLAPDLGLTVSFLSLATSIHLTASTVTMMPPLWSSAALCHGAPCREHLPPRGQVSLAVWVPGSPSLSYSQPPALFPPCSQDSISVMVSGASCIGIPNPNSGGSVSVNGPEPQAWVEGGQCGPPVNQLWMTG